MRMNQREIKELALSKVLIIILAVIGLALVVWLAWIRPSQRAANVHDFDSCAAAGNAIQESYPEVCVAPTGQRFVNPDQQADDPLAGTLVVSQAKFSKVAIDLQSAILAEVSQAAPACVKSGRLVDTASQQIDPTITLQGSLLALIPVGCDTNKTVLTLFGKNKENVWQVLDRAQPAFTCAAIIKGQAAATKDLFVRAGAAGTCLDPATGATKDIDTLYL